MPNGFEDSNIGTICTLKKIKLRKSIIFIDEIMYEFLKLNNKFVHPANFVYSEYELDKRIKKKYLKFFFAIYYISSSL